MCTDLFPAHTGPCVQLQPTSEITGVHTRAHTHTHHRGHVTMKVNPRLVRQTLPSQQAPSTRAVTARVLGRWVKSQASAYLYIPTSTFCKTLIWGMCSSTLTARFSLLSSGYQVTVSGPHKMPFWGVPVTRLTVAFSPIWARAEGPGDCSSQSLRLQHHLSWQGKMFPNVSCAKSQSLCCWWRWPRSKALKESHTSGLWSREGCESNRPPRGWVFLTRVYTNHSRTEIKMSISNQQGHTV